MTAGVLESLAVPSPCLRTGVRSSPPAAMATMSSPPELRRSRLLPEFMGLRIATRPTRIRSAARISIPRTSRRAAVLCEAPKTAVDVPNVTKATWQSLVLESGTPVLVEFWASWCGPCCMIHPTIVKLSKDYEGKLKCFRLNTDENPDIATQYGIRSIPTMMVFKNGEKKDSVIGAVPESTLISFIERFV